jgi:TPR repeat protein
MDAHTYPALTRAEADAWRDLHRQLARTRTLQDAKDIAARTPPPHAKRFYIHLRSFVRTLEPPRRGTRSERYVYDKLHLRFARTASERATTWTMSQALRAVQAKSEQKVVDGYAFLLSRILHGDAAALDALGSMLTYGVGLEKSPRLAAACYSAASRASYAGATFNLAGAIIERAGVPKDVPKGLRLLRAARRAGVAHATNYLGFCYRTGEGVKKDERRGFALSLEAAEAGVPPAQYDVGMCLLAGTGVKKDAAAAQRWIARAAKGYDRDALDYVRARKQVGRVPRAKPR